MNIRSGLGIPMAISAIVGAAFFARSFLINDIQAAAITISSFTVSSSTTSATNVTYTYTFAAPSQLTSSDSLNFGLWGNGVSATFCSAAVGSILNGSEQDISASFGALQVSVPCQNFVLPVTGTVNAGTTIILQVTGVSNPTTAGNYLPSVSDSRQNQTTNSSVPSVAIGTPMLKVKVTEPDGSTAVSNANVWIHTSNYSLSGGGNTDLNGIISIFDSNIWGPQEASRNGTYIVEVFAPAGSAYSNAIPVTGVSLTSGSTVDYSQNPLGPVSLSRVIIQGTVRVPDGCATCIAAAGSAVPEAQIDVMDTSFDPTKSKHTQADGNGVFRIGGLATGSYRLEVRLPWNSANYLGLNNPNAIEFTVNANGSVTRGETTTVAASLPVNLGNVEFALAQKTISGTLTKSGAPLSGASVRAFKMMGMGMAQATTGVDGTYNLKVGGGTWMVMPDINYAANFNGNSEDDVTADWIYCDKPKSTTFTEDNSVETSANNDFDVKATVATITGTVADPDGNPVSGSASVDLFSKDGCSSYASVDWGTGTFSVGVPAGTYNVNVHTWNQNYGSPAMRTVTVASGTTDLGTLSLVNKGGTISGRLWADSNNNSTYDDGEGIGNIRVEGFKMGKKFDDAAGGMGGPMGGGDWASTTSSNSTDTKGQFSLKVTKGTWVINVMADRGMMGGGYDENATNYIYSGAPANVTITTDDGTSANNNFKLSIADATISGRIIDADTEAAVSGLWGFAFAEPANSFNAGPMMGAGMGSPISNGTFNIKVPAGDYRIGVDFPPDSSGYTPSDLADVTAVSGETTSVDISVVPNNATLRVRFKNEAGALVTDLNYAEVFLDNGAGGHIWKMLSSSDLTNGYADINVGAGTWRVGVHIDATGGNNYMNVPTTENNVTAIASQTVTKDITLQAADSVISGTVNDPSGNPLSGVWVSLDNRKTSSFEPDLGPMFTQGEMTDASGQYSLTVPAGTYKVQAFFPPEAVVGGTTVHYLNPTAQETTVSAASPATVNFAFGASNATISGTVTLNGAAQGAFVSAYSSAGGYNEALSSNGSFTLNVTNNDTWYVRAMYESGSSFYLSDVYEVQMGGASSKTQNLAMNAASFTIPDAVSATFNCANAKKITLANGTELSIPANAIVPSSIDNCDSSDSGSNITITITPTAQMSLQDKSVPIGVGYEINALDANGAAVSNTFSDSVTLTIPYTDTQITESLGQSLSAESLLSNGYWDTSTSAWRTVDGQVLDTTNNTLTISTDHFTLYGVLAATDPSTTRQSVAAGSDSSNSGGGNGGGGSDPDAITEKTIRPGQRFNLSVTPDNLKGVKKVTARIFGKTYTLKRQGGRFVVTIQAPNKLGRFDYQLITRYAKSSVDERGVIITKGKLVRTVRPKKVTTVATPSSAATPTKSRVLKQVPAKKAPILQFSPTPTTALVLPSVSLNTSPAAIQVAPTSQAISSASRLPWYGRIFQALSNWSKKIGRNR